MKTITKEDFRTGLETGKIVLHLIDSCIINGSYYNIKTDDVNNTVTLIPFNI